MQPTRNLITFPGKIHLIQSDQELSVIDTKNVSVLGFDTETRPSFRKGERYDVALLQLASHADAYLIRLQYIKQFDVVRAVLENRDILKVGVAIRDDLKALQNTFKFMPQGFIELQTLAKEKGLANFGLKGMTEEVLDGHLSKRAKMTNWENRVLTTEQLAYAATDAWVGLAIYQKLITRSR